MVMALRVEKGPANDQAIYQAHLNARTLEGGPIPPRAYTTEPVLAVAGYGIVWASLLYMAFTLILRGLVDTVTYFFFSVAATGLCLWASLAVKRPTRSIPSLALILVTFVLLLEEAFLNSLNPTAGLGLALLATLALPLAGSISKLSEDERYALQACGLMFATRLAFIPFPQRFLKIETVPPSIYALAIALIIAFLFLKRTSLTRIGLTRGPYPMYKQVTAGASVGIVSGIIEYYILKPSPIRVAADNIQATLYVIIVMTLFVGLGEEMLFRGIIQESYQNVFPSWSAILIASIQFGVMHYGWLNPLELLFANGMGLIFGYSFWKTKSLIAPVTTHSLGNIVMFHIAAYSEIMLAPNVVWLTAIIAVLLLLPTLPWRKLPKPEIHIPRLTSSIKREQRGILKKHIDQPLRTIREEKSGAPPLNRRKETRPDATLIRYQGILHSIRFSPSHYPFTPSIVIVCPYCRRTLVQKAKYCDICGQQLLGLAGNSVEDH